MSFSEWGDSAGIDRRKLLVIVISAVAAGAALVLMALMVFNKNTSPAQATPATGGVTAGDAAQEAAQPLERLTAPPENIRWTPYTSLIHPSRTPTAIPSSPTYGPATNTATYAAGYDRSSGGVLIAAAQIAARYTGSPEQDAFIIGPDRDASLAAVRTNNRGDHYTESIQGFKFIGQPTNQQALVDLLISWGPQYEPSACTMDMRWSDNDWRMYAHGAGGCLSVQQAVSDADRSSYVQWGPG
jgi:hypothetical protein